MSFTRQLIDFPFNNDNNCMQSSQDVDSTITISNYEEERERENNSFNHFVLWHEFHVKCFPSFQTSREMQLLRAIEFSIFSTAEVI